LLELIQSRLMERVVSDGLGEKGLNELAEDVAEHRRDPYAAVADVLSRAGLK
jgi:hypothetical protein